MLPGAASRVPNWRRLRLRLRFVRSHRVNSCLSHQTVLRYWCDTRNSRICFFLTGGYRRPPSTVYHHHNHDIATTTTATTKSIMINNAKCQQQHNTHDDRTQPRGARGRSNSLGGWGLHPSPTRRTNELPPTHDSRLTTSDRWPPHPITHSLTHSLTHSPLPVSQSVSQSQSLSQSTHFHLQCIFGIFTRVPVSRYTASSGGDVDCGSFHIQNL